LPLCTFEEGTAPKLGIPKLNFSGSNKEVLRFLPFTPFQNYFLPALSVDLSNSQKFNTFKSWFKEAFDEDLFNEFIPKLTNDRSIIKDPYYQDCNLTYRTYCSGGYQPSNLFPFGLLLRKSPITNDVEKLILG
jgi:hypothetical protein